MTITIELQPDELAVLNDRAKSQGVGIDHVLHDLVAQLKASQPKMELQLNDTQKAAIALMQAWNKEDQTNDPEELAERERELEEFKVNINRWRAEEGRSAAY